MTKHLINFLIKSNFDFRKAMKNYKYYGAIEESGLFDEKFYSKTYDDVKGDGLTFPLLAGILLLFIKMDQVQLKTYAFLTAGLNFFLVLLVIIFFPQAGTLFRITDALSLRLMADSLSQLFVILVSVIWEIGRASCRERV